MLLLAPLTVELKHRGLGIGKALISKALSIASETGYKAVFLSGDPSYYGKSGFTESAAYGIGNDAEIPDKYFLCKQLSENFLKDKSGIVRVPK